MNRSIKFFGLLWCLVLLLFQLHISYVVHWQSPLLLAAIGEFGSDLPAITRSFLRYGVYAHLLPLISIIVLTALLLGKALRPIITLLSLLTLATMVYYTLITEALLAPFRNMCAEIC